MKLDIIGDIHGCYDEFHALTVKLGYDWSEGVPLHPSRILGFVGDLTDRGPNSLGIVDLVWKLVMVHKRAYYVPGNHCNKLYRYFLGRKVQVTHGLETTVAEYEALSSAGQTDIKNKMIELYEHAPLYHQLDDKKLVIAHAGINDALLGKQNNKVQTFVLYGDITGETHPDGSPVRRDWAQQYKGKAWIVYGHTPVREARFINHTVNIDTGCVFGGNLSALRYPEMDVISVPSSMPLVEEKFRSFN
ncbi:bis(5'-nucleosyl)-tetraphosphatase PrpE [Priestia taiwanensis]|uniref:Bis(5'-nucleosyl)-tetraphosphatase PrpE [asymmetrical] n=1 Tax=Priestia taiwanensis TaxID=1347902 RepID=A0A917EQ72_9BACI|nr:bis(5'-nucleosyl)-tetraphosphatase PrpE [Priestia taiwanensis]MBM7364130.1 protein phosphatase [Priestia taiwanensis]GGE71793.1 bis(5'-nucleosyl)-tetraphosphatase PrpE [asymmetrical] [Priestia taiwanensis]